MFSTWDHLDPAFVCIHTYSIHLHNEKYTHLDAGNCAARSKQLPQYVLIGVGSQIVDENTDSEAGRLTDDGRGGRVGRVVGYTHSAEQFRSQS